MQRPLHFPRVAFCHFNRINCRNLDLALTKETLSLPSEEMMAPGEALPPPLYTAEVTEEVAAR